MLVRKYIFLAASFAVVACAPPGSAVDKTSPMQKSAGADAYAHLNAEERQAMSEIVADDGEEKLTFESGNDAFGKFSEALQLNPENHRARFWWHFAKVGLVSKGVVGRVRPLYVKQPNGLERYMAFRRSISIGTSKAETSFATDGPQDIDTDEKFQEWLDLAIVTLDELRIYLRENRDREYSIRAPVNLAGFARRENKPVDKCSALKSISSKFGGCTQGQMVRLKLNRADIEQLQFMVARQMVTLALLYAYKANPIAVAEGRNSFPSSKMYLESLAKGYDGSLFARNRIELAKSVLPEWIAAQRYVLQNQDELCGEKYSDKQIRPGFLFSSGVCVIESLKTDRSNLAILETLALGQPITLDQSLVEKPITVDFMKALNAPPERLSSFLPTQYDESGDPTGYADAAYATYFNQGTANVLLNAHMIESAEKEKRRVLAREEEEARWRGYVLPPAKQALAKEPPGDKEKRDAE